MTPLETAIESIVISSTVGVIVGWLMVRPWVSRYTKLLRAARRYRAAEWRIRVTQSMVEYEELRLTMDQHNDIVTEWRQADAGLAELIQERSPFA